MPPLSLVRKVRDPRPRRKSLHPAGHHVWPRPRPGLWLISYTSLESRAGRAPRPHGTRARSPGEGCCGEKNRVAGFIFLRHLLCARRSPDNSSNSIPNTVSPRLCELAEARLESVCGCLPVTEGAVVGGGILLPSTKSSGDVEARWGFRCACWQRAPPASFLSWHIN